VRKTVDPAPPWHLGMRVALFLIGVGSYLNMNAVQPLLPMFREVFRVSEAWAGFKVGASTLWAKLSFVVDKLLGAGQFTRWTFHHRIVEDAAETSGDRGNIPQPSVPPR